jgi:hypothetical protein
MKSLRFLTIPLRPLQFFCLFLHQFSVSFHLFADDFDAVAVFELLL